MKPWNKRPFEIRNLFNPGFCGVILLRSMQGYEEVDPTGLPFSLSLLILPLCLHKDSRNIISDNSSSYLLKTVGNNPQILIGFADRVQFLLPYTFEALGFVMQYKSFSVSQSGHLILCEKGIRKKISGTNESIECQQVAYSIGKKFAKIADKVTIYATFGIRP